MSEQRDERAIGLINDAPWEQYLEPMLMQLHRNHLNFSAAAALTDSRHDAAVHAAKAQVVQDIIERVYADALGPGSRKVETRVHIASNRPKESGPRWSTTQETG